MWLLIADCTDEFKCTVSGECFDDFIKCDQRTQCIDKSDELDCVGGK